MKALRVLLAGGLAAALVTGFNPIGATAHGGGPTRFGPVNPDQPLRVLAKRHDLRVGTAVDMAALGSDTTYRGLVSKEFSAVTAENVMKWESVEPTQGTYNWGPADELVSFARANGQEVHGHTLIWHNQLPAWLTTGVADGTIDADELRAITKKHVQDQVRHFRGKVARWDVLNEAVDDNANLRDTIFLQKLGPGYIADLFRWAHEADPRVKLYLNDYNVEGINAKSDKYYAIVKELQAKRVPIHGFGIQGHLSLNYDLPNDVPANMARFDKLGLETALTEVDIRMTLPVETVERIAQAEAFSLLLEACLLTRKCVMFTVWGFTDKYNWVPGVFTGEGAATPFDENFQPKHAYRALQRDLAL